VSMAGSIEWDWIGTTLEGDIEECEVTFYALTALHFYSTSRTKGKLDHGRPTTRATRRAFLLALDQHKDLTNLHGRSVAWWKPISIATNASCPEFKKSNSAINSHFQKNRKVFLVGTGRQVRDRFFSELWKNKLTNDDTFGELCAHLDQALAQLSQCASNDQMEIEESPVATIATNPLLPPTTIAPQTCIDILQLQSNIQQEVKLLTGTCFSSVETTSALWPLVIYVLIVYSTRT
jgi:hypothetical protein